MMKKYAAIALCCLMMCTCMSAALAEQSEIRIDFTFPRQVAEDLDQLNALLATLQLTNLRLDQVEGYVCTTTDGEGNFISVRYGLRSGVLVCTRADDPALGRTYQLETLVVYNTENRDSDTVVASWRAAHPDRALRTVISSTFSDCVTYIMLHHEHVD